MTPHVRSFRFFAGLALCVLVSSCRSKEVSADELFTARWQGLGYLQQGQLPEAETQFKKIVGLAPKEPFGHANLGLTYLRAGRFKEAEAEMRRAQELDPQNVDVGLILARLYFATNRPQEARTTLERLRDARSDPHVRYALAELEAQNVDPAGRRRHADRLKEVVALAPSNIAVRLKLVGALASLGESDSVTRYLEEIRRIPPEPPREAKASLDSTIQLLRSGKSSAARAPLDRFLHLMELTKPYQAALADVQWLEGPLPGRPVLTFNPKFLVSLRRVNRPNPSAAHFVDATVDAALPDLSNVPDSSGLTDLATAAAMGDYDGDGTDDLLAAFRHEQQGSFVHLYKAQGGQFLDVTQRAGISMPGGGRGVWFATFADYDNDGWLDLLLLDRGGARLLHNTGNGRFEDVTAKTGLTVTKGARKALVVDLDHDGDIDFLFVGGEQRLAYRNNGDGTFTETSASMGLAGPGGSDAAFGDFDGDGRLDIFITSANGNDVLLHNDGARHFSDATGTAGITSKGSGAVAVGDYNNDGLLDIFVAGANGAEPTLWLNTGTGTFRRDVRSARALARLRGLGATAAQFVDTDNDGWLDLVVTGKPLASGLPTLFLFHNDGDGKFSDRSSALPSTVTEGTGLAATDIDGDGDQDLFVPDGKGVRFLRNEGGNAYLAMQVQLKGLRTGSGKNNDFGIGSKLELRAGELHETRVATGRVTHFGLGPHLKADVLRVEWPNGVPQTIYFPGSDQDVLESELLKGSCAFLYTWDGKGFRFVTDVMWRSALGMPLGLMAGSSATAWAPAGASQEYMKIPGTALQPRKGRYVVQLTEELWETAYADEVKLIAVDHPDSVDIFVDERYVPPGRVRMKVFQVVRPRTPVSATDERGNDVLPALRKSDDIYAANLTPSPYQGVVEPHELVIDLGPDAGQSDRYLFLRGWIYPTDASINVALSQQSKLKVMMPSLEVRDGDGRWTTAIPNIGFPSGKDKTMVIDLAGKFQTQDHHVRIRTNMQIYWDQAFVSGDATTGQVRITRLDPLAANLHARGFSRMYRRGGRYGPFWYAYNDVKKENPWRPIEGAFTRYGDVLSLLKSADDMYVIMGPGDEATIEFDASAATSLPPGWTRDFLLYSDGWIKDSDLNTAFGTTVGPLPFHAIKQYPPARGEAYPGDAAHQRYLLDYNTRIVTRREAPPALPISPEHRH